MWKVSYHFHINRSITYRRLKSDCSFQHMKMSRLSMIIIPVMRAAVPSDHPVRSEGNNNHTSCFHPICPWQFGLSGSRSHWPVSDSSYLHWHTAKSGIFRLKSYPSARPCSLTESNWPARKSSCPLSHLRNMWSHPLITAPFFPKSFPKNIVGSASLPTRASKRWKNWISTRLSHGLLIFWKGH